MYVLCVHERQSKTNTLTLGTVDYSVNFPTMVHDKFVQDTLRDFFEAASHV